MEWIRISNESIGYELEAVNEGTVMQRGGPKQAEIEAEVGQSAQDNNPMTILKNNKQNQSCREEEIKESNCFCRDNTFSQYFQFISNTLEYSHSKIRIHFVVEFYFLQMNQFFFKQNQ